MKKNAVAGDNNFGKEIKKTGDSVWKYTAHSPFLYIKIFKKNKKNNKEKNYENRKRKIQKVKVYWTSKIY